MKHCLQLIVLSYGILFGSCLKAQTNIIDSLALVNFFYSTTGAAWNVNANWLTGPVSSWYGVTTFNNRVTSIDLSSNNLQGSVPVALEDITMLSYLNLSDNILTGALPANIGNLLHLSRLDLRDNQLSGKIPQAWSGMIELIELYLQNNQLTDTIPSAVLHLDSLHQIYVNNNNFTELPDINSSSLTHIYVHDNNLTFQDFFNNLNMAANQSISPQAKVGESLDTLLDENAAITLSAGLYEHSSEYQWYKDGIKLQGENNSQLLLTNILLEDTGTYYCEITNLVVQSLTLWSNDKRIGLKAIGLIEVIKACSDESILLNKTDLVNYSQNVQAYNWDLDNDGQYDDAFGDSVVVSFNTAGLKIIGAQIIMSGGQTITSHLNVDVYPAPNADFSISTVCAGSPVVALNHSTIASGAMTYLWRMGEDTSFYTYDNATHIFENGGNHLIKLIVASEDGCSDSTYYTLPVHDKPNASFTNSNACENKEVHFENESSINQDSIVSVQWIFSSSVQSIENNPYHVFGQAGYHNVKLIVMSDKGCSDSIIMPVEVKSLPDATVYAYPSPIVCSGDSVELAAYSGYDKYFWSNGDTLANTIVKSSGIYDVLIISDKNCMSKGFIEVEILEELVLSVSNDTTISLGEQAQLWVEGATDYTWYPYWSLDDNQIDRPLAKPWSTQEYEVIGTDENGCKDTVLVNVEVIKDYKLEPYNLITPNGDGKNDVWVIENIDSYRDDCTINIYDRRGNLVTSLVEYQNDWDATRNGNNLPTDTYYYTIKCSGHSEIYKGDLSVIRK